MTKAENENSLLKVKGLKVMFPIDNGFIKAVEGVDIDINHGECVALVGESGCGKSVTSQAIMKLVKTPPALISVNAINFKGKELKDKTEREMEKIRGKNMSIVFQDALTSLNPVMTIGRQIDEIFMQHNKIEKKEAKKLTIEMLKKVGVPDPEHRYYDFPHQLSGGMRQRVLIAIAVACEPELIIADEPTTALDVTIQAQILDMLGDLKKKNNMSILLITHDLSVVANVADKVYVMYSGKIVEKGTVEDIFKNPVHPYTIGLLNSVPKLSDVDEDGKENRFIQIPDSVPNPANKPKGCYFHPRCSRCIDKCKLYMPKLEHLSEDRLIRCWNYEKSE